MPRINKELFLLVLIIVIGAFLRFYKLNWGDGLFTHPDEYHIISSVNQLSFPNQMHPHFFSYGTVTIYLIYFAKQFINLISLDVSNFIIGRFFSAFFSTITILIGYIWAKNFLSVRFSLLAALLISLTPGLIQQAHFATPESALTLFILSSLLFVTYFIKANRLIYLILSSIFFGLTLGVKFSGFTILPAIILSISIKLLRKPPKLLTLIILFCVITTITLAIVAPFIFLDFNAFRGNLEYEGNLAVGKIPVFYTRQFINTIPIIFQMEKILPYALGPSLLITSILGFILLTFQTIKKRQAIYLLVISSFISLFGFNGTLFAKWTRFIAPTFPFFAIFVSFFLEKLYYKNCFWANFAMIILLTTSIAWSAAFFSIYLRPDVRVTASNWIEENTNKGSTFLVEGGNMVDIPINGSFKKISLDFYALEQDRDTRLKIAQELEQADYLLVQSRRVFMNHQRLPKQFPKTAKFYDALFNGSLGFDNIRQFDSYPKLSLLGFSIKFPDESAEETWSVFDHPVIRVFQKNVKLTKEQYAKFLE